MKDYDQIKYRKNMKLKSNLSAVAHNATNQPSILFAKNTCLLPEYQEYGRKAEYASCVRIPRDDKVTKNHFLFLRAYQPQPSKLYRPTSGLCFGERGQMSISLVSE